MRYDKRLTKAERVWIAKNIKGLKFSENYYDYQNECERDVVYNLGDITDRSISATYQPPMTDDGCVMFDVTCNVEGDDKQNRQIAIFAEPYLFDRIKKRNVFLTIEQYELFECDIGCKVLDEV